MSNAGLSLVKQHNEVLRLVIDALTRVPRTVEFSLPKSRAVGVAVVQWNCAAHNGKIERASIRCLSLNRVGAWLTRQPDFDPGVPVTPDVVKSMAYRKNCQTREVKSYKGAAKINDSWLATHYGCCLLAMP